MRASTSAHKIGASESTPLNILRISQASLSMNHRLMDDNTCIDITKSILMVQLLGNRIEHKTSALWLLKKTLPCRDLTNFKCKV
jgi:hypothetical protein